MSETDKHDRTEDATPKRLEEARKRGQIPRSRDLNAAAVRTELASPDSPLLLLPRLNLKPFRTVLW